jgi:hypothetical protein
VSEGREPRSYLVECYWPGVNEQKLGITVGRAPASDEMSRQGHDLRFVASILVPSDETVFWLFDGDEADVGAVSKQAGVTFERVLPSLRIDVGQPFEPSQ